MGTLHPALNVLHRKELRVRRLQFPEYRESMEGEISCIYVI